MQTASISLIVSKWHDKIGTWYVFCKCQKDLCFPSWKKFSPFCQYPHVLLSRPVRVIKWQGFTHLRSWEVRLARIHSIQCLLWIVGGTLFGLVILWLIFHSSLEGLNCVLCAWLKWGLAESEHICLLFEYYCWLELFRSHRDLMIDHWLWQDRRQSVFHAARWQKEIILSFTETVKNSNPFLWN